MRIKTIIIVLISLVFSSCAEIAREAKLWTEIGENEKIPGSYHFLEEDGTKIFLPKEFKRYNISDFQKVLAEEFQGKAYDFQVNRINKLKDAKGELYIYFDEYSGAVYTINTTEYLPISKDEAQILLGMIRSGLDYGALNLEVEVEKIDAKYSGVPKKYVFKAIYRVSDQKSDEYWYSSSYIITSNLKTVYIHLITSFDVEFDPYILKTIL